MVTYPAKHPPVVTPENWNAMVDIVNGFTPSGTFISPHSYVIGFDGVDYYACNAFQILFGGASDAGGVDGADPVAVIQAVFDALTSGGNIFFKRAEYDFGTSYLRISNSHIHVYGEAGAYLKFSGAFSLVLGPLSGASITDFTWNNMGLYNIKTDNTFTLIYITKGENFYFTNSHFRVAGGNALSQGYFAKLISTVNDTTLNINFIHNTFEHLGATAFQISGLLIYRVTGLHVIDNTFINVNDIIHSGIAGGTKAGLVYKGNYEYATATTFHTEGHDIWDFHNVTWTGNVQYCPVDTGVWASGGMLIEHDCENWTVSGNVFTNGITFTATTGVAPQRIHVSNNVFRGRAAATPYAFVFSTIDDTNPSDITFDGNSISNFGTGYINWAGVGWTGFVKFRNNSGLVTENYGTSTGTGAAQTIPHGCSFTPTYQQVLLTECSSGGALAYQSTAPDATNIYVTATNAKTYNWYVSGGP